jgi:hypothetical protein
MSAEFGEDDSGDVKDDEPDKIPEKKPVNIL